MYQILKMIALSIYSDIVVFDTQYPYYGTIYMIIEKHTSYADFSVRRRTCILSSIPDKFVCL